MTSFTQVLADLCIVNFIHSIFLLTGRKIFAKEQSPRLHEIDVSCMCIGELCAQ